MDSSSNNNNNNMNNSNDINIEPEARLELDYYNCETLTFEDQPTSNFGLYFQSNFIC